MNTTVPSLLDLHTVREANNITSFAGYARDLEVDRLVGLYQELRKNPPRRHSRDKRYFGPYFGKKLLGVMTLPPAEYLTRMT
jgi:hypothetical protein